MFFLSDVSMGSYNLPCKLLLIWLFTITLVSFLLAAANKDNDIALLRIDPPVVFTNNEFIRPVCLPDDTSEAYAGKTGTITGWGTLQYREEMLR